MENTSGVSFPIKGMISDLHGTNMDEKSYRYAINASVEDLDGNGLPLLQNTHSNILAIDLPEGFKIIGRKVILEQDRVILMLVNPTTGESQIGEYRNCYYKSSTDEGSGGSCIGCSNEAGLEELPPLETVQQTPYCKYRELSTDACLNFNIDYPIDIEYKITDCTLNIYFTDNFNERRYLYFDYSDGTPASDLVIQQHFYEVTGYTNDECHTPIYSDHLDCNKIKYHPDYSRPCIDFIDILPGGSLKSGSYQAFVAYADVVGNPLSNYTPGTQIVPLRTKDVTIETDYVTSRSIKFQISNLEQSGIFLYYNFVIAQTIDNFTEFKFIGTFPIGVDVQVYTGNNPIMRTMSADEVFFRRPYYKTAKSVTKSNEYLFFGGLSEFPKMNLQPVAELIKFRWQTCAMKESVYADPKNTFYFRSYNRDEVYALGLVFEASNGEDLCVIHVPGPNKTEVAQAYGLSPDTIINTNDVVYDPSCDPDPRNKLWQVYNMAKVTDLPHLFTDNCDKIQTWERGTFSYWESTERYPNNPEIWGELCGKPIRHHKMPDSSVTHIHDGQDTNKGFDENNIVFPLGVWVDPVTVRSALLAALGSGLITQEQYDRIASFRVVRGNRAQHKSIIAKGLLYDVWSYNKNEKTYYYPNYPYNDLGKDRYIGTSSATYDVPDSSPEPYSNTFTPTGRYTFHSPDTHFYNPKLGTEIKLETTEYGEAEGYFNECQLQAKYKFLSTASYLLSLATGVATALADTTEKKCTTYTITSDYKQTQEKSKVHTDWDAEGKSPYGNVSGTLTEGTGSISTSEAQGSWNGKGDADSEVTHGDIRMYHNNPYDNTQSPNSQGYLITYDSTTGQANQTGDSKALNVDQYTQTTCTGTTYQNLNAPGLLSALTGALGFGESLQGIIYRVSLGLIEMNKMLEFLKELIPLKNLALQHNSVGRYNNYRVVPNWIGWKRRAINRAAYLDPTIQTIDEVINTVTSTFGTINFNNWNRESSVYIKIKYANNNELFQNPNLPDTSRYTLGQVGGYNDVNKRFRHKIASYYASIKNYVPDQYGSIDSIEYIETNSCSIYIPYVTGTRLSNLNSPAVFGGDTFINRFAIKRKMPFFLQTAFGLPNQTDIRYQDLGNVGYPNYYFNTPTTVMENLSNITNLGQILNPTQLPTLFGVPKNRLDVDTHFTFFYQKGKMYLYSYGVPYFFVESDVNTEYRHAQNSLERDYYPHKKDLDEWLQERYVPITHDNYFFYNNSFSKQAKESVICINKPDFQPNKICKTTYPFRLVYSEQNENNGSTYDNWLVFKANNYKDFPITNGELVTADGIENDKILVRFENTAAIFAAYDTIQTDSNTIQVGTGGIFTSRPKEFSSTDLGYFGSQHRDILRTEFGHVWVDAKRGQVFLLSPGGGGMEEISNKGMKDWFKENLPFQLQRDFKNIDPADLDNNFKGIGLHMSFDKKFSRIFITKLDYKKIDGRLQYDPEEKVFFYRDSLNVRIEVDVTDTKFFCNKSWTISYNFLTKSWVSFHSFLPNVYLDWIDYFQTSIGSTIWSHNLTNKSYQVYYGKLYPFIIMTQSKPQYGYSHLDNVEYMMDAVRYHNEYDWFVNDQITFNKAVVFNSKQCTGMLHLVVRNYNDLSEIGQYPNIIAGGTQIEVTNREGMWAFNQFNDSVVSSTANVPFITRNCANTEYILNPTALNYYKSDLDKPRMRGDYFNVMLINDKYSNYKMIFKHLTNKSRKVLG